MKCSLPQLLLIKYKFECRLCLTVTIVGSGGNRHTEHTFCLCSLCKWQLIKWRLCQQMIQLNMKMSLVGMTMVMIKVDNRTKTCEEYILIETMSENISSARLCLVHTQIDTFTVLFIELEWESTHLEWRPPSPAPRPSLVAVTISICWLSNDKTQHNCFLNSKWKQKHTFERVRREKCSQGKREGELERKRR